MKYRTKQAYQRIPKGVEVDVQYHDSNLFDDKTVYVTYNGKTTVMNNQKAYEILEEANDE